ncbi:g3573 [Coccomyxa viridis]|uniref:sulfiredoxin n=1 Tax=Coccomyxa viridis TaxID=1274662 RepID=A0ABP1FN42_9CHLO
MYQHRKQRQSLCVRSASNGAGSKVDEYLPGDRRVREVKLTDIRRPLSRTRSNDPKKVQALAESISEIGLQEPIDVLDVEGQLYGFSGCHRYEAHQVLGKETIRCRIRKGSKTTLKMHMM